MKKITVIIPAYNEEKTIGRVLIGVLTADFESAGFEKEIIVVDDGSTDGTFDAVSRAASSADCVKIIRFERNLGKGAALRAGIEDATGDIISVQDADLEYDPSDIPKMAARIADGSARVVYGSRFLEKNPVIYASYYLGNKIISGFIGAIFLRRVTDSYTCRKLFDKNVLKEISLVSRGFEIEAEITSKILQRNIPITEIPIRYTPRTIKDGKKISLRDAFLGAWTAIRVRFARSSVCSRLREPLRICMLSARFHPHIGGAEKQGLLLASRLCAGGNSVFVCTQSFNGGLPSRENVSGVEIYRLAHGSSFRFMLGSLRFLISKRKEYDAIHVLLASSPAIAAVVAGSLLGKKVLIKFGCSGKFGDIATSRARIAGRVKLSLLKHSSARFVCPSRGVFDEALTEGFPCDRFTIIPNGADTSRFAPVSVERKRSLGEELGLGSDGGPVAVFTGRFERQKGLEGLVGEWGGVVQTFPSAKLVLVGRGTLEENLRRIAARLGAAASSVIFAPPTDEVEKHLAAADFFVLPSSAEGISNSMLEAMASGLAVIAADISANKEVITDGENGYLAPSAPTTFAEKIKSAFALWGSAADKAMRERARETALERYSVEKMLKDYIALYRRM
ncbi:MAG: glycosyltransferase [Endomicrobiia bacterium]|nr:glycosyltransferase [Endomicrobiia bacterium]